jgi:hypothetical protein
VIILYIALFLVACAVIGKFANRGFDRSAKMTDELDGGTRQNLRPSPTILDTEENPRNLDDGTDFGYKEFD